LIPQTTGFVNRQTLSKCKPGVRIVNTARGGLISESDLLDALNSGQCAGAAIDIYGDEQRPNKLLLQNAKVICTPHLNASTMDAQRMGKLVNFKVLVLIYSDGTRRKYCSTQ
jgi:D-3-phosphoglycerate dehydrogenase